MCDEKIFVDSGSEELLRNGEEKNTEAYSLCLLEDVLFFLWVPVRWRQKTIIEGWKGAGHRRWG